MRTHTEVMPPGQVDPRILHRLFYVDHLCLLAVGIIALTNLFPGVFTSMQKAFPASWLDMRTSCAAMALCAALSLFLSEETQRREWRLAGRAFGMLTVTLAATSFLAGFAGVPVKLAQFLDQTQVPLRQGSLEFLAFVFLLMGVAALLVATEEVILEPVVDGIGLLLSIVTLSLVLQFFFRLAGMTGSSIAGLTSAPTLCCLALLTLVVNLRRAERGFLSVLWGYGTGSRIARVLAPVLLLLPITREIARSHLLTSGLIPAQYAGAVLTSVGTVLGFVLLLLLARFVNRMHEKVQDATLRDELTGLHSVKGFYLLAEQAFRYSRRAQEPFSVIFADMDNLKMINDQLGHSMGSVALVETAKLLTASFRETDVIGRVGGDEFVVAGPFDQNQLAAAVERLRDAVARKNQAAGQRFSISLSVGSAVTEDIKADTLQDLVAKADEAMYVEKRAKKQLRVAVMTQSQVAQQSQPAR